jgi:hypothetical protein
MELLRKTYALDRNYTKENSDVDAREKHPNPGA